MSWRTSLFALCLAACTVANPLYTGNSTSLPDAGDAAVPGLHDAGSDGSVAPPAPDLSVMKQVPDLLMPGACVDDARSCSSTNNTSLVCESGAEEPDRVCPAGSKCKDGYCGTPTTLPTIACDTGGAPSETLCTMGQGNGTTKARSCQPFVVQGNISWFCDTPVGAGLPGNPCLSGSTCRSGFCADNGTCFRACTDDSDCPQTAPSCSLVKITVEGVVYNGSSCLQ